MGRRAPHGLGFPILPLDLQLTPPTEDRQARPTRPARLDRPESRYHLVRDPREGCQGQVDEDELNALGEKALCRLCIGDAYLRAEVRREGRKRTCSYCGESKRSYTVLEVAERVERVFDEHYVQTANDPDSFQQRVLADPESRYDWSREGDPVVEAKMDSGKFPQEAAEDIQAILADRHATNDYDMVGVEDPFDDESHYQQKKVEHGDWPERWRAFEQGLKTEMRFFSRPAMTYLADVFTGVDQQVANYGEDVVFTAGPGETLTAFYRARVFQNLGDLEAALKDPAVHLGPPPSHLASAGRMNARGVAVFYGATTAAAAIAEVRPPVGSKVVVARFDLARPLRLLNLFALSEALAGGSLYDPAFGRHCERVAFLRSLAKRMTQPVMPADEAADYLPTQAIADFLASEAEAPLDGILFPSVQSGGNAFNVVLFHKAARVAPLDRPRGTHVSVRCYDEDEDGLYPDYSVSEGTIRAPDDRHAKARLDWPPPSRDTDPRPPSLSIDRADLGVHHINAVAYTDLRFGVRLHAYLVSPDDF